MARYSSFYRRPPGREPRYRLGEERILVAERDYLLSLYAVDVKASNGLTARHVLAVPVAIKVGLVLTEDDSQRCEAGDMAVVETLANAVQFNFNKFRTFPANELGRFVI